MTGQDEHPAAAAGPAWFHVDAERRQRGPVDDATLRAWFASGQLPPETLVWRDGMAGWQPAREVLAPMAAAPAVAPLPPAAPATVADARAPLATHAQVVPAGFWRRAAALCVDTIVLWVAALFLVNLPLDMMYGAADPLAATADPMAYLSTPRAMAGLLASLALQVVYFAGMHSMAGQATLGKRAVGIKVCMPDGGRIGFGRGIARYFAWLLGAVPLYLGWLIAAFTPHKRALHDMLCNTRVVDRWAHTDQPQLQKTGLDGVTIAILVVSGLLLLLGVGMVVLLAGILAAGQWN